MDPRLALTLSLVIPNVINLFFMMADKSQARKNGFRIPEAVFFTLSLIGCSIGCLAGMYLFHHKTRKPKFFIGIPLILILQIAAAVWLVRSDLVFIFQ